MQSYNIPFKISDINFDNIVYKNIKSNSKKTVVFLKYKKGNSLRNLAIQTPSLINVNSPVANNKHWDLDIPLHGKRNDKVNEFINFLKNLDKKIIYDARINSSNWFSNFDSEEINYQEIIRSSDNKHFSNGIIRIKLIKNNDFNTIIQMCNRQNISINDIPKNSWIKMIIEIQAIWINKNGFGIFLKPVLVSFNPIEIKKYKFIEDSEDEVDDVIDSDNSIFMVSNNNNVNDMETSNLRIKNDSLDVDTSNKFSSTSSSNKKRESDETTSSDNISKNDKISLNI